MEVNPDNRHKSIVEKDLGNACYKKKEFMKALDHYNRAINLDPTNITFYTNKAAVFFEQGEHEKCRQTCLEAVDIGRRHGADDKLIAKALSRIGNSLMKDKRFKEAKKYFMLSQTENGATETIEKIEKCEREIEETERLAYINPDISQEEKLKGNKAFEKENFEDAILHYTEAIKRNPENVNLYCNRAACCMRLMRFKAALENCETTLRKDPNYVKGHICKGAALEAMLQYDKAMDAYQKALDLDPNLKIAIKAYFRCLSADYNKRNNPEEICLRAKAHPDLQLIFSDPNVDVILNQIHQDPESACNLSKNPDVAKKIQKLIETGVAEVQI